MYCNSKHTILKKQICICLDESTYATLKAKARAEGGRSVASLIREILVKDALLINIRPATLAENLASTSTI